MVMVTQKAEAAGEALRSALGGSWGRVGTSAQDPLPSAPWEPFPLGGTAWAWETLGCGRIFPLPLPANPLKSQAWSPPRCAGPPDPFPASSRKPWGSGADQVQKPKPPGMVGPRPGRSRCTVYTGPGPSGPGAQRGSVWARPDRPLVGTGGRDDAPPPQARQMFAGEMASLEALRGSGLVRAPRPLKILDLPGGGAAFVMEYLKMRGLSSHASKLGEQMADLHLHNQKLRDKSRKRQSTVGRGAAGDEPQHVTKFGFHTVTCCGFIPQVNEWQDDWPTFFTQHRLQAQLDLIEKDYADREARELWSQLQVKIPDLFCGLEIVPALLHGDLWSGNVAEDEAGPIIYDPASFYGHSEFELAIALMFGGFPRSFFSAYHKKIPKAPGFDRRLLLYQLFNYLNHWNHFGREYRGPSLGTMRRLLK